MPTRILFGKVEVYNSFTKMTEFIPEIIYVEGTDIEKIRNYILSKKPFKERSNYKIIKFQTETAKHIGDTVYDI